MNPTALISTLLLVSAAPVLAQDEATTDLVNRLRDEIVPAATDGTGVEVNVSGSVAAVVSITTRRPVAAAGPAAAFTLTPERSRARGESRPTAGPAPHRRAAAAATPGPRAPKGAPTSYG